MKFLDSKCGFERNDEEFERQHERDVGPVSTHNPFGYFRGTGNESIALNLHQVNPEVELQQHKGIQNGRKVIQAGLH